MELLRCCGWDLKSTKLKCCQKYFFSSTEKLNCCEKNLKCDPIKYLFTLESYQITNVKFSFKLFIFCMERKTDLETSNDPNRKNHDKTVPKGSQVSLKWEDFTYRHFLKTQFLWSLGIFKPSYRFRWWGWRVDSVTVVLGDFKS